MLKPHRTTATHSKAKREWSRMLAASLVLNLPDLPHHAVGELQRTGARRERGACLRQAATHDHFLADVVEEHLAIGAVAPQRHRRVGLERPVLHLAGGILYVHVEIRVGILPVEPGQRTDEIAALL